MMIEEYLLKCSKRILLELRETDDYFHENYDYHKEKLNELNS